MKCLPPEYMHGILLGLVKTLWHIWKKQRLLTPKDYTNINNRFLKIRRPHEIHRLPRDFKDTSKWKATEWKSWLLHDRLPCLEGILDDACFESYVLLVKSIATLLKPQTTGSERDICEQQLLQFVGECEELYGEGVITFGIHLALHLVEAVRRCGPLWSFSAFGAESEMYYLKQIVHSPNGVDHQMAKLYVKRGAIKRSIDYNTDNESCKKFCKALFVSEFTVTNYERAENGAVVMGRGEVKEELQNLLSEHFENRDNPIKTYERAVCHNTVARSIHYTRPKRNDDTVFNLKDKRVVQIHNFLVVDNKCYVHCQELAILPYQFRGSATLEHLFRIQSYESDDIIIDAEELDMKVAHFSVEEQNFISFLPNTFEIQ